MADPGPPAGADAAGEGLRVWCLCAAWCRHCDAYRPTFEAAAREAGLRAGWIDIEDDEALLGELDVADFPTLVIAAGPQPLFAGVLAPQPGVLRRVLQGARDGGLAPVADAEVVAFVERVRLAGR